MNNKRKCSMKNTAGDDDYVLFQCSNCDCLQLVRIIEYINNFRCPKCGIFLIDFI